MNNLLLFFLITALVLNLFVSVLICKREDLEHKQKFFQVLLIWSVPFIVAIGLLIFYSTQDQTAEPFQREFGGGTNDGIGGTEGGD